MEKENPAENETERKTEEEQFKEFKQLTHTSPASIGAQEEEKNPRRIRNNMPQPQKRHERRSSTTAACQQHAKTDRAKHKFISRDTEFPPTS